MLLLDSLLFLGRGYKVAVVFGFAALHIVIELLFPVNIGNGFLYGGQFFFEFFLLFGQHDFAFGDGVFTGSAGAMSRPITLADQGSFFAGGKVVTAPGVYKDDEPTNFAGETLHGDAAYVFWQAPVKAKKNALVFLHGYGQSGKTWETTPDGRDGFQNIFLAKGYKTFIVDEPRRGRVGNSTVPVELKAQPQDQLWYDNFRIGQWPDYYDNAAVPRDAESRAQFFYQMTPDTGAFDVQVVAETMEKWLKDKGLSK